MNHEDESWQMVSINTAWIVELRGAEEPRATAVSTITTPFVELASLHSCYGSAIAKSIAPRGGADNLDRTARCRFVVV